MKLLNNDSYNYTQPYAYLVEKRLFTTIAVIKEIRKAFNDSCSSNTYKRVNRIKKPAIQRTIQLKSRHFLLEPKLTALKIRSSK